MSVYYNEIDPRAAEWLRELIAIGELPKGDVDERDIRDVKAADIRGYTQVHLFAGIGGWPLALRFAGWAEDRPVWTGSCPCPPFSVAGKGQSCPACGGKRHMCHPRRTGHFVCLACGCDHFADDRHLWPEFSRLIHECRPAEIYGEQVASKDGRLWLSAVQADLEDARYGFVGADICAAGVGTPHIRQRLWFYGREEGVGDTFRPRLERHAGNGDDGCEPGRQQPKEGRSAATRGRADGMADADDQEQRGGRGAGSEGRAGHEPRPEPGGCSEADRVADSSGAGVRNQGRRADAGAPGGTKGEGLQRQRLRDDTGHDGSGNDAGDRRNARPLDAHWQAVDWLFSRDDRWRPVEPGTLPLVDGLPTRVGLLRGYGNAIVPQVAQAWIESTADIEI